MKRGGAPHGTSLANCPKTGCLGGNPACHWLSLYYLPLLRLWQGLHAGAQDAAGLSGGPNEVRRCVAGS